MLPSSSVNNSHHFVENVTPLLKNNTYEENSRISYFRTKSFIIGMNSLIHISYGLNSITIGVLCSVSCGCRIHWLLLCRGVKPSSNECPGYDTKQSDVEVLVMLEVWEIWNTTSLPSFPSPLWPGVVAYDRSLFMG